MQERSSKVIAIVALCVGVVGLSLGFAAFTANLTVESGATYTPNEAEQFDNVFGFDVNPSSGTVAQKYAKAWTGITAEFDGVGQTKTFTAKVINNSQYDAATTATSTPLVYATCTGEEGTTKALVDAACAEINGTVAMPATVAKVNGEETATVTINGPTTAVDGKLTVTFKAVEAQYTTAK